MHWDTETAGRFAARRAAKKGGKEAARLGEGRHRVCQVYSSAVPVTYVRNTTSKEWEPFARAILSGTYEATLLVAAIKSVEEALELPGVGTTGGAAAAAAAASAAAAAAAATAATTSSSDQCQAQAPPAPKATRVFLTSVGGGAFGNRTAWIRDAIEQAMKNPAFAGIPLDVRLVCYRNMPREMVEMEKRLRRG